MVENIEIMEEKPRTCACGHADTGDIPVLNVNEIPHSIRHATIHGAFNAIQPGQALIIVANHAPIPLFRELSARFPIDIEYLQEGPEQWHVKITRQ